MKSSETVAHKPLHVCTDYDWLQSPNIHNFLDKNLDPCLGTVDGNSQTNSNFCMFNLNFFKKVVITSWFVMFGFFFFNLRGMCFVVHFFCFFCANL